MPPVSASSLPPAAGAFSSAHEPERTVRCALLVACAPQILSSVTFIIWDLIELPYVLHSWCTRWRCWTRVCRRHSPPAVPHVCRLLRCPQLEPRAAQLVQSMALLDPVCLMTCAPHLLSNFIYKPPRVAWRAPGWLDVLEVRKAGGSVDRFFFAGFDKGLVVGRFTRVALVRPRLAGRPGGAASEPSKLSSACVCIR